MIVALRLLCAFILAFFHREVVSVIITYETYGDDPERPPFMLVSPSSTPPQALILVLHGYSSSTKAAYKNLVGTHQKVGVMYYLESHWTSLSVSDRLSSSAFP